MKGFSLKKSNVYKLPPVVILFISLIGGFLFLVSNLYGQTNDSLSSNLSNGFLLSRSKSFSAIVRCSEHYEAVTCFRNHKMGLEAEFHEKFSPSVVKSLADCIDVVLKDTNDLALLLNVQTCFHQADITQRVKRIQHSNNFNWKKFTALLLSLVIQIFVAFQSFIHYLYNDKETKTISDDIFHINERLNNIDRAVLDVLKSSNHKIFNVENKLASLSSNLDKDTSNNKVVTTFVESKSPLTRLQAPYPLNSSTCSTPILKLDSGSTNSGTNIISINQNLKSNKAEVEKKLITIKSPYDGRVFDLSTSQGKSSWLEHIRYNKSLKDNEVEVHKEEKFKIVQIEPKSAPTLRDPVNIEIKANKSDKKLEEQNVPPPKDLTKTYEEKPKYEVYKVKKLSDRKDCDYKPSISKKIKISNSTKALPHARRAHSNQQTLSKLSTSTRNTNHLKPLIFSASAINNVIKNPQQLSTEILKPTNTANKENNRESDENLNSPVVLSINELKKLPKIDPKTGKVFRRIFVPEYGWMSSKKLQTILTNESDKENVVLCP